MQLVSEAFPLLVLILPQRFDAQSVQAMAELYEPYFAGGERYAAVSLQPPGGVAPGAAERKLIIDWVDSPRVRRLTEQLCVASATVVPNAVARGALTAMMWVWKPSIPIHPVASLEEGLTYCVQLLKAAGIALPMGDAQLLRLAKHSTSVSLRPGSATSQTVFDLPATITRNGNSGEEE
jgi:hypothetical protein